jgi:hypothetical protein
VLDVYDSSLVHEIDALRTMAIVMSEVLAVVAPIQEQLLTSSKV